MNVGENTDQIPVRGPCILIDDLTVYIIRSDFFYKFDRLTWLIGICNSHFDNGDFDKAISILKLCRLTLTVVCIKVHKIVSVWCKIALGEVGVSLPWDAMPLVLLAPG